MRMQIGPYRLDVDVERTRAWYAAQKQRGIDGCDCAGCRNYRKAIPELEKPVRDFLEQFGIDPMYPEEISMMPDSRPVLVCYHGCFPFCGTLLEYVESLEQEKTRQWTMRSGSWLEIGAFGTASISCDDLLLSRDFPRPFLKAEISFLLPWRLEEDPKQQ